MKRLTIILVVLSLTFCFTACKKEIPIATSVDEFDRVVGSYIDLDLYTKGENSDGEGSSYDLTTENIFIYNGDLDYAIPFKKGEALVLALLEEFLAENGWHVSEDANDVVLAMDFEVPYVNEQNHVIYISRNEGISPFMPESIAVTIKMYEQEDYYDVNSPLVKVKNTPDFLIKNELDKNASLQEVIDIMGVPYRISYNPAGYLTPVPTVEVLYGRYGESGEGFLGSLVFSYHAETGEMLSIRYSLNG